MKLRASIQSAILLACLTACVTSPRSSTGPRPKEPAKPEAAADSTQPLRVPAPERYTEKSAARMFKNATGGLAPVYAPIARQIVREFDLAHKEGIGIDVGGGPGTLVIELCRQTKRMYWINSDVNTHCFGHFARLARKAGVRGRCGFVFADAKALPFRDAYADVVVSRGSLQFWGDKRRAFSEILRVLKPGGRALIGRGLAPDMPVPEARQARKKQGGGPKYDGDALAAELRQLMTDLRVGEFRVLRPKPPGAEDVNYGVWVQFRKPAEGG